MKSFLVLLIASLFLFSCTTVPAPQPTSSSGVSKATVKVATDLQGHTSEQLNIMGRYAEDNKPGSIKHLYIISAYTGQVIIYSTVKGKATSSGKRLTPLTVNQTNIYGAVTYSGFPININGVDATTSEVLQDDGTYGNSVEYLYWFDSKGTYHQQYITGGMIVHISNQPIAVKNIVLNLENVTQ